MAILQVLGAALFPSAWWPEVWLGLVCLLQVAIATVAPPGNSRQIMPALNLLGLAGYIWLLAHVPSASWLPMLQRSNLVSAFQLLVALACALTNLFHWLDDDDTEPAYFVALAGLALGLVLLPAARHLLLIWLCIETISLCSYLAVGLAQGRVQASSGLKYLLYGAAASAIMLYGMSWLYGLTGTLHLAPEPGGQLPFSEALQHANPVVVAMALLLVLVGLFFKLGAWPLHLWVPDVYASAPLPLVALLSVAPKLAVMGTLLLLLSSVGSQQPFMQQALALGALVTLTAGNILALGQTQVRRLLAYSGVAQVGFLLAALVPGTLAAVQAGLFYAVVYLLANYAFVWLLLMPKQEPRTLTDFAGQGSQSVPYAALWALVLLTLIGLPPVAGFFAKFLLFSQLFEFASKSELRAAALLLVGAALNAAIAVYYYVLIPWWQWRHAPTQPLEFRPGRWVVAALLTAPLLYLFFFPQTLQSGIQGWLDAP